MFGVTNSPWSTHLPRNILLLKTALAAGMESGDLIFTSHSAFHILMLTQLSGRPIDELLDACERSLPVIQKVGDSNVLEVYDILFQSTQLLMGNCSDTEQWDHGGFNEQVLVQAMEAGQHSLCLNYYHYSKMVVEMLFGRYRKALAYAEEAEKTLGFTFGWLSIAEHCFYHTLIMIELMPTASPEEQPLWLEKIESNLARLKSWTEHCYPNFAHKYLLVRAQIAHMNGHESAAITDFNLAIESARKYGFLQHAALANELTARYWLERGKEKFAQAYMQEAYYGYRQWGANAKADAIAKAFSQWHLSQSSVLEQPHAGEQDRALDIEAVLKASQVISAEIQLEKLLTQLLTSILELAGAQNAWLLLNQDQQWRIQGQGQASPREIQVMQSQGVIDSQTGQPRLPQSMIAYVARTSQQLVLANASEQGLFTQDPYVLVHRPKSVICSPIRKQNELVGILYLENNLVDSAFTPGTFAGVGHPCHTIGYIHRQCAAL